jgi:cephalosporin hydroxylase
MGVRSKGRRAWATAVSAAFVRLYEPHNEHDVPSTCVRQAIVDQFGKLYYHSAPETWMQTTYRGVTIYKCPLDLWVYQELFHRTEPDLIIETGTASGGSAYFLGDLCDTLGRGRVASIDIEGRQNLPTHPRVTYLTGSSTDESILNQVRAMVPKEGTVVVILDSDHSAAHVERELAALAPLVTFGSYIVVEDSNINGHPALPSFGPGPMEALKNFLSTNDEFEIDASCEKFLLTFNPSGYLKRVRPPRP